MRLYHPGEEQDSSHSTEQKVRKSSKLMHVHSYRMILAPRARQSNERSGRGVHHRVDSIIHKHVQGPRADQAIPDGRFGLVVQQHLLASSECDVGAQSLAGARH